MAARQSSRGRTGSRSPEHGYPFRSPSTRDRSDSRRSDPRDILGLDRDGDGGARYGSRRSHSRSRSRRSREAIPTQQRNGSYYSRSRSRSWNYSRSQSRDPSHRSPSRQKSKIFIDNLTRNVHMGHLREIFALYGTIEEVDLPVNSYTGANRGSAYIIFASPKDADDAVSHMHEAQLDGTTISVSIALPNRRRSPSPLPPPRRASLAQWEDGRSSRGHDRPPSFGDRSDPYERRGGERYSRRPAPDQYRSSQAGRGRPPRRGGRGGRGGRQRDFDDRHDANVYRRRSYSRSRSPRRWRSQSYNSMSRSRSRSPARRHESRREVPPPRPGRRRSYSYSSYSSRSVSRSRSRSRSRSVSRSRDRYSGLRR